MVSRGTGGKPAARLVAADTESPMQHGPAAGWCSGAALPEGGNLHVPLLACGESRGPATATV